jgi:hypothetical protein
MSGVCRIRWMMKKKDAVVSDEDKALLEINEEELNFTVDKVGGACGGGAGWELTQHGRAGAAGRPEHAARVARCDRAGCLRARARVCVCHM